jgi:8-oxo-dGTP pyrophosphatase MutT (NUDIX family)
VVVVHRPRYDDWTFPKGKAEPGEPDEDCAAREVEEETGLRCRLGAELPSTSYRDSAGRAKVVRWWTMKPAGGELAPATEADEARWVPLAEVEALLTYERDRELARAAAAALA